MNNYRHYISGFFSHRDQAEVAFSRLISMGIPETRLKIFEAPLEKTKHQPTDSSNQVLKDVLVDGAVGTAVGLTIGGLGEVALVAANVTLFAASPVIAPLIMMGWGAAIGGVLGASVGAASKTRPLLELVNDAIKNGQLVLVALTETQEETEAAKSIFKELIGDYQDLPTLRAQAQ